MSQKIVIFTVTGDQGSSVARYLVKDGGYKVVGITRNPDGDSAKELAKLGVELVKGDMTDPSSYSLALQGAYGVFVNADFWARYFSNGLNGDDAGQYEEKQSKDAISESVKAGVKHIIYSTLDNVGYVPHMDYKAAVTKWAKDNKYPVTNLRTSHYISNLIKFAGLKKNDDGSLSLTIPAADETPLINYAVEQTGGWVLAAFKNPTKYIGTVIDACSEIVTYKEWAAIISEITGKKVTTPGITKEEYLGPDSKKYHQPEELYLNYKAFVEGLTPRSVEQSKEIYPEQWDTRAWAAQSDAFKALVV